MSSNGLTLVKRTGGVDTSNANAEAYQILIGYSGYVDDEKIDGTMPNRGAISHSLGVNGSYTIPNGWHNGSGKITQSLATQGSVTVTPGTSTKLVCAANKWTTGDLWVAGDADLVAGNIKKGVSMFGLTGTYAGCVTTDATITADKILTGYSAYGSAGTKITGNMPNRGAISHSLGVNGSYTIPNGWHNGNGKVTQTLPTQGSVTVTPGTSSKLVCAANKWTTGNLWVAGDADLVAGNIKKGVSLFGITGTYAGCVTSDATITADKILTGYSAYGSAGTKITGTMPNRGTIIHSLAANGSYTIPNGWHSGYGKVKQGLTVQEGKVVIPSAATGAEKICNAHVWTTGDIYIEGDSNLKAENIKKGVTIFGVTGTYEAFPTPVDDGTGKLVLTLFENGRFVNGGIASTRFYQEYSPNSGSDKDAYTGAEGAVMANWVRGLPPTTSADGLTIFGAGTSKSSLVARVGWAICIKIPIPTGKKMILRADAIPSGNHYPNITSYEDKQYLYWGKAPEAQWPSGNWHSPKMNWTLLSEAFTSYNGSDSDSNAWTEKFCIHTNGLCYTKNSSGTWSIGGYILQKLWAVYTDIGAGSTGGGPGGPGITIKPGLF